MSIPSNELRVINDLQVFGVTGVSSVFAYLWLLMIVQGSWSKDVIEPWEGILTFLWFPLLIVVAFLADKGYFSRGGVEAKKQMKKVSLDMAKTKDLAKLDKEIRAKYGDDLTEEEVAQLITSEYGSSVSRAAYRIGAIRSIVGGKRIHHATAQTACKRASQVRPEPTKKKEDEKTYIEFLSGSYTVGEDAGHIELPVRRRGGDECGTVRVHYQTVAGDATEGSDFEETHGDLVFPAPFSGETKLVRVPIVNDKETEGDEFFSLNSPTRRATTLKLWPPLGRTRKQK
jgi:solute carrier family 8 (sodium/calcium exchanger)